MKVCLLYTSTKEHSSSGRVPSKLGYRYYVDHLLDPLSVTKNDLIVIQNSLGTEYQKIDEIEMCIRDSQRSMLPN